jgi:hypothetical protein
MAQRLALSNKSTNIYSAAFRGKGKENHVSILRKQDSNWKNN